MFSNYAQLPAAVTLVTTTEAAAITLPVSQVAIELTAQGRVIRGLLNVTPGTGTTALVLRCRQGTGIAGALVGTADTVGVTAAVNAQVPFSFLDTAIAPPANNVYTVTVQQTGATANGTINDGAAELYVPDPGGAVGE